MLLSDTAARQAKPAEKDYFLPDGKGLSLLVHAAGRKYWTYRFTFEGGRKKMSLGIYPLVSLREARSKRDEAQRRLATGVDPRIEEEGPAVILFRQVADEWDAFRTPRLSAGRKGSAAQARRYLDKDILPALGDIPITEVRRADVLAVVRAVEARGAFNVAEKVRTWLHQIFRFAIAHEYTESSPASDLDIVAAEQPPVRHNPWLAMPELSAFLKDLKNYKGDLVRKGVQLLLLTGVRTAEVRFATHGQFDLEEGVWTIPAASVKQLQKAVRRKGADIPDYLVPLSRQAIQMVREIQAITRQYDLLLPGLHDQTKALSENTLNRAIKSIGYEGRLTGHGIRGTLSTALYEMGWPSAWIEAQLSHADTNQIRGSYNHALYVEQRRQMMQAWADFLDRELIRKGAFDPRSSPQYQTAASAQSAPPKK
jgi:integrase